MSEKRDGKHGYVSEVLHTLKDYKHWGLITVSEHELYRQKILSMNNDDKISCFMKELRNRIYK